MELDVTPEPTPAVHEAIARALARVLREPTPAGDSPWRREGVRENLDEREEADR